MRVLMINTSCGVRSPGRICAGIAEQYDKEGHEVRIACGRLHVPEEYRRFAIRIGSGLSVAWHGALTRLFDRHGLGSKWATRRFLAWAEAYDPDLLWLHNIHGYYLNYELLFDWIKSRPEMEVRWTLHDCWAFTGHCCYFTEVGCEQWHRCCQRCPAIHRYPATFLADRCASNFHRKKRAFTGVKHLTLITPSQWLANLTRQSFLREYPVRVVHNSIDTTVFRPTKSDFRERFGLQDKKIVLGVASVWEKRKGLSDFIKLSSMLTEPYIIVLVGLNRKQIASLPRNMIGIERTDSAYELAGIYTAADVFVNPTYEENYPTVNLEAEACGTRVVTYDTGGCCETIRRPDSVLIPTGDIAGLAEEVQRIESAVDHECSFAISSGVF